MPWWSPSARVLSAGTAQVGLSADTVILRRAGCRRKKKNFKKAKGLEFKRQAGMFAELLPSAQHGARVLAPSLACGLLWAEDWLERTAETAVGEVRISISQHMSHLPGVAVAWAAAGTGARGPIRPCGCVGGWGGTGSSPTLPASRLPGSITGEPRAGLAVVRAWLRPLCRAGSNFAVRPNDLQRSPPTEILLRIWDQSVSVSFPSHGPV